MSDDAEPVPDWTTLFSADQVQAACHIFNVYIENPSYKKHAQDSPEIAALFKAARAVLMPSKELLKERRQQVRKKRKDDDHEQLAQLGIRSQRKQKLVAYNGGSVDVPMPGRFIASREDLEKFAIEDEANFAYPDPPTASATATETATVGETVPNTKNVLETHQSAPAAGKAPEEPLRNLEEPRPRMLNYSRNCHICSAGFKQLHHFYDQLCPRCADFNFEKRFSSADLSGRVCLLTGARLKIGYCIALKLLRMGATVLVTTRFPHDAARRYALENDFQEFKGRLFIYGIDFRDIPMVHHLTAYLKRKFSRLDVIINNAAQTVRKPPVFYEHLMESEQTPVADTIRDVIEVVDVYRLQNGKYIFDSGSSGGAGRGSSQRQLLNGISDQTSHPNGITPAMSAIDTLPLVPGVMSATNAAPATAISSAALSQVALLPTDTATSNAAFPPGQYDRDDQQIDLRRENSWTMEIGQISTLEMMECHVINSFAPWVLISELRPLMESTRKPGWKEGDSEDWDKFIVNVSAMEGQFYRPMKTIFHPHTNMAKASLNMLTRTAATGFAQKNIYMTAVDTGWITDENPQHEWQKREHAPPPLDEFDAAMRVIDPVLVGVRGTEKMWGVFLKNYRPTRW